MALITQIKCDTAKLKFIKQIVKNWYIFPLLAVFVFTLTQLASRFPEIIEKWYSQKLYLFITTILSTVSSVFSFSIDDWFYFFLIIAFFTILLLLIFRKMNWIQAGKIILNVLSVIYILFYFFWGFNYFRSNLNTRLGISRQELDVAIFTKQFQKLIEDTNKSYCTFNKFNKNIVDSLVESSYKNLAPALQIDYPAGKRKAKKITAGRFFSKAGISGYYGPFFSEIHVNSNILPEEYPFVLAHEKAHQFGITGEAEANFYSWLVCTRSNSKQLQYSANLSILRYFLYQGYRLENYSEIVSGIDEKVKLDIIKIREHWNNLRNEKVDKIATKVNDTYLKTNKIENGIEDYKGVVKFVMDYTQDSLFQEKWHLNDD